MQSIFDKKYCECGCEKFVNLGKRFLNHHHNKGEKHYRHKVLLDKPIVKCFCNCGNYALPGNNYINHHHHKGKHRSEETKRLLSNIAKARIRSPKTKQKQSDSMKKVWQDKEYSEKMSNIHKEQWKDPEYIENVSIALKNVWKDEKYSKRMSDIHIEQWKDPEYVSHVFTALNIFPNKPEKFLLEILNKLFNKEYEYNGNYRAGITIGGFVPDFVNVNGQKKLIEFNGCVWHCCRICKKKHPLGHDSEDIRKHDKRKILVYKKLGWTTLTIWTHDLSKKNLEKRLIAFNFK